MAAFQPPPQEALAGRGRVATLGMLIIDHFEVRDDQGNPVPLPDAEILGGGGVYATSSARMFLPATHVAFIADVGPDLGPAFRDKLNVLGDTVWFRSRDGKTTRAVNQYTGRKIGEGHQSFKYISPQLHLWPHDYTAPPSPFTSPPPEWIHVVCDINRAGDILDDADQCRKDGWKGQLAWEPLVRPTAPEQRPKVSAYIALARRFAVFSPNHLELQTILDEDEEDVETCARMFHGHLAASPGPVPAIVVRAGEKGAFTLSANWTGWVPAFWQPGEEAHVVGVTGGGNSFMGGLLAGLLLTDGDHRAASIYGSTAASFAIEQRGLPTLTTSPGGHELWNGTFVWDRLRIMARRVAELEKANVTLPSPI